MSDLELFRVTGISAASSKVPGINGDAGKRGQQRLSPELIALVSSVELSSSDWWRRSASQAALSILWLCPTPMAIPELVRQLDREFAIKLTIEEVRQQLEALVKTGAVVAQSGDTYKISEEQARATAAEISEHDKEESVAQTEFCQLLAERMPGTDAENAWQEFNEKLLIPLIHSLGAHTYDFLRGVPFELNESPLLERYLKGFATEHRSVARDVAAAFLDPDRRSARLYVVNRLATYFFIQATRLPRASLEALSRSVKTKVCFTVFVDTNLLFSLLDLHENPANEAAEALSAMRPDLEGIVDFRLYVTNETLLEARESLTRAAVGMDRIVLTPQVIKAAASMSLNGLRKRFVEQAQRADGVRNSQAYFDYYTNNLLALARAKGLELYNEDLSALHTKQAVVDDLLDQKEIQAKRRAALGRPEKSYSQIQHDVVLWHWVRSKRAPYVESPLLARFWIVTIDYAFLGFDVHKTRSLRDRVPLCVHPTTLVQMLAFWAPRSEALDSAIVRTLRMPLLFFDYDAELESATVKILQTLSRFENLGHLSADSIVELVASEALRARMNATSSDSEMVGLIESELIEQQEAMRLRFAAKEDEATRLREAGLEAAGRADELTDRVADLDRRVKHAQLQLEATAAASLAAEERATGTERRLAKSRLVVYGSLSLLLALVFGLIGGWLLVGAGLWGRPAGLTLVLGSLGLAGLAWLAVVRWVGTPAERVAATEVRGWLRGYFVVVVLGVVINAASSWAFN